MAGVYIEGLDFPKEQDGTYKQFRGFDKKLPMAYVFTMFVDEDWGVEVHPWDEAKLQVAPGTVFKGKIMVIDMAATENERPVKTEHGFAERQKVGKMPEPDRSELLW